MELPALLIIAGYMSAVATSELDRCWPCTCTDDTVNCQSKHLTVVPDLCTESVVKFILTDNILKKMPDRTFMYCTNLRTLLLDNCSINALEQDAFFGLDNLRDLSLRRNDIGSGGLIPKHLFRPFLRLESLDLSYNAMLGKRNFSEFIAVMTGLNKTYLTSLLLVNITSYTPFHTNKITSEFLSACATTTLRKLDLSNNMIRSLSSEIYKFIPNLTVMNVSTNKLDILSQTVFGQLQHIRVLDISKQAPLLPGTEMVALPSNMQIIIPWPTTLRELYAQEAFDIGSIPTGMTLNITCSMGMQVKYIDSSRNNFQNLYGSIEFEKASTGFTLDLSNNNMQFLSSHSFGKHYSVAIRKLLLSNNRLGKMLSRFSGPFRNLANLLYLDLSRNQISRLTPGLFSNLTNLVYLDLSRNPITRLTPGLFSNLTNLVYLDLSRNHISRLTSELFSNSYRLANLTLADNEIMDMNIDMSGLKHLKILDLRGNNIRYLSPKAMKSLEAEFQNAIELYGKPFILRLDGNPLECSCNSLGFLGWCYNKRNQFRGLEKSYCMLKGKTYRLSDLRLILPILEKRCTSGQWLDATIGLLCALAFLVTVSVFLYRHRWDIKYCILQFKVRRTLYEELQEDKREYEYDAFVAHSERDFWWVRDYLIPNLEETDNPVRFCLHQRDFILGQSIEENILKSISNSRRALLILSNNFVRSGWCKFEMYMARHHHIERGVYKIVVVMLEEVPVTDMPRALVTILRQQTYLEWPGVDGVDHVTTFWPRLRAALRSEQI